jgi:hypothetical protein
MRKVGADDYVQWHTGPEKSRGSYEATPYTEESTQDADKKADDDQIQWVYEDVRYGEIHFLI